MLVGMFEALFGPAASFQGLSADHDSLRNAATDPEFLRWQAEAMAQSVTSDIVQAAIMMGASSNATATRVEKPVKGRVIEPLAIPDRDVPPKCVKVERKPCWGGDAEPQRLADLLRK